MDGRPLYEAIKLPQAEKSVKGLAETVEHIESQESPYTPEEEEEIKRRLRRLGISPKTYLFSSVKCKLGFRNEGKPKG